MRRLHVRGANITLYEHAGHDEGACGRRRRLRAAQRLLAGGLLRGPQQHPPLRGRRCWQPAEAARTGWAVAGAVPGPGLMDAGPPAAQIARGGT